MTTLLEEAMKRVTSLPQDEQKPLRALAEEALAEDQGDETRPIEDLP
jgi:hypothetical protein